MAELATLARPYARAAFEIARAGDALAAWSAFLALEAMAVRDRRVAPLIGHPRVDRAELAEFLISLHDEPPSGDQANFLRVAADNGRLQLLPAVAELFNAYRADAEKTLAFDVRSAAALTQDQQERLEQALAKRFGRKVLTEYTTDQGLLGGAVIRSGDTVIDGSVRSKLAALGQTMKD